jgi:hypothetical protein
MEIKTYNEFVKQCTRYKRILLIERDGKFERKKRFLQAITKMRQLFDF